MPACLWAKGSHRGEGAPGVRERREGRRSWAGPGLEKPFFPDRLLEGTCRARLLPARLLFLCSLRSQAEAAPSLRHSPQYLPIRPHTLHSEASMAGRAQRVEGRVQRPILTQPPRPDPRPQQAQAHPTCHCYDSVGAQRARFLLHLLDPGLVLRATQEPLTQSRQAGTAAPLHR